MLFEQSQMLLEGFGVIGRNPFHGESLPFVPQG